MPGSRILVIENDPSMLKLTAAILRGGGHQVSIASSAEQALTTLQTLQTDVILVDLKLPGLDGLGLARRIREEYSLETRRAVVLAMTAFSGADVERAAREAGCAGFLRKPFERVELLAFVEKHLRVDSQESPDAPGGSERKVDHPASAFLDYASSRCRAIMRELDSGYPHPAASEVLHRMAREAEQYGYGAMSPLARQAAETLDWFARDPVRLRVALEELSTELVGLKAEADIRVLQAARVKASRIVVAGFEKPVEERVCALVEGSGASVQAIIPAGGMLEGVVLQGCDLAIVRIGGLNPEPLWLSPEFQAIPLVLAGEHDRLMSLDPKVLSLAREVLVDDWQGEEALLRITRALSRGSVSAAAP